MKLKRTKPAKNGKSFKKGDQCVQNPSSRQHRDNVKKNFFTQTKSSGGPGGLTVEALKRHDEVLDDEISMGGLTLGETTTSGTEVSTKSKAFSIGGLTDCSNITFHKVLNKWTSKDALDQEKCAILAAVTEVIRSKGGSETETEYFAALMTALEASTDENGCTALAFLLSLVVNQVPKPVLQSKFSDTCKCIVKHLETYYENGRASLMTALLQCLSATLMVQDAAAWSEPSTQHTFQIFLTFTVHPKPKVRKLAHSAVHSIVKLNHVNHSRHPSGAAAGKFAMKMLGEKQMSENPAVAHHVLNLLKQCLQYLNADNLKELCETILGLLALNDPILKKNTMSTLCAMFKANPPEENLSSDLNMKLISVLYEFQPSVNDVDAASEWLSLMLAAHSNLSLIAEPTCLKVLPLYFGKAMKFLLSENKKVVNIAAANMKQVSQACLETAMGLIEEDIKTENSLFVKIFELFEAGLGFKYAPVWDVVLRSIAYLYQAFGKTCAAVFKKNIGGLIDLHETPDFPFKTVLEQTVGSAIKAMGPEMVLTQRPLNIIRDDGECQFPNAWLLPVLKEHIQNTELGYFIRHFLPMAVQVRQKALAHREAKQDLEAKVFETLLAQIWSLLPGFCSNPVDLVESFPKIAKILGTALKDTANLRQTVLLALRTLISKTNVEQELKCVGTFSKNFMPILFNLYTDENNESEALSLGILETIKVFIAITDGQLISVFIKSLLGKLEENASKNRHKLMDLAVSMTKHAEGEHLRSIYKLAIDHVSADNKNIQKKAYRILEELLYSNSEACKSLVEEKLEELKPMIVSSLSASAPSSKAPRLRCLSAIVKRLDLAHKDFLETIIPEVILCTKAVGGKARAAAFDLIVDIGSAFVYLSTAPKEECIEKYFEFVMAGLAGSPHMAGATLCTFTKLVHEYRYDVSAKLVSSVLQSAIQLLRAKDCEVVKSCLFFVRAVCKILDASELNDYLELMVKNLFSRTTNSKTVYRVQIRSILQKLEKKCGYKLILSFVPDEHKKFLVHIHKQAERAKRDKNRATKSEGGHEVEAEDNRESTSWEDVLAESDEEEEMGGGSEQRRGSKFTQQKRDRGDKGAKGGKTWIVDGEETVDLLDPSSARKVVATKPKPKRNQTASSDVELSADGKFVFNDEDDMEGGDYDDEGTAAGPLDIGEKDMLAGFDKTPKKIKLGKRKQLEHMPGDEDDDAPRYQPGGRGIHRDDSAPPTKIKRVGEEYKAKKSGGDVKLRGKQDPFAYVPLDRNKLNRRKSAKLSGQFHGMVKAAKKGATSGSKHRKNVAKNKK